MEESPGEEDEVRDTPPSRAGARARWGDEVSERLVVLKISITIREDAADFLETKGSRRRRERVVGRSLSG